MSSKKSVRDNSVSIRIEDHVRDKLRVLQEAYGTSSVSETIDALISKQHPNINQIKDELNTVDDKRAQILSQIKSEDA